MISRNFVPQLFLFVLLLATAVLGANFWEHRVRQDESEKVRTRLSEAWQKKLAEQERIAADERLTQRNQHVEEIARIRSAARRDLVSLRQRATRAEQALTADRPGAPPACTGDRLARDDAEFLTRFAALAAEQQSRLIEAHKAYETCNKALRSVTQGTQDGESSSTPGVPGP